MDGSRLNRLKVKLQIGDFGEMDQKQFNDLITNLSYLDQETIRHVIRNVPDLSGKVLNYFSQLNDTTKISLEDYLDSMKAHQQILSELLKEDLGHDTKNRIADELLEHSKWLRKEATITRVFKMAVTAIGVGLAFVFVNGMGKNTKYSPEHASVPEYKKSEEYTGNRADETNYNDYQNNNYENTFPYDQNNEYPYRQEPYQGPDYNQAEPDSDEEFERKLHRISYERKRDCLKGMKPISDQKLQRKSFHKKPKPKRKELQLGL